MFDRTSVCSVYILVWSHVRLFRAHWQNIRLLSAPYLTEHPSAPCKLSDRTPTYSVQIVWPNTHLLGAHFLTEHPPTRCKLSDRTSSCSVHIIRPNIHMLGAHCLTEHPTARCIFLPNIHDVEVRGMEQTWLNLRFLNYRKSNATCKFLPVFLISNSFDLD